MKNLNFSICPLSINRISKCIKNFFQCENLSWFFLCYLPYMPVCSTAHLSFYFILFKNMRLYIFRHLKLYNKKRIQALINLQKFILNNFLNYINLFYLINMFCESIVKYISFYNQGVATKISYLKIYHFLILVNLNIYLMIFNVFIIRFSNRSYNKLMILFYK